MVKLIDKRGYFESAFYEAASEVIVKICRNTVRMVVVPRQSIVGTENARKHGVV